MKKYNILLVGSGNFGSRHLQSIVKSKFKIKIFVVEPRSRAVKISKKRIINLKKKIKKFITIEILIFNKEILILLLFLPQVIKEKQLLSIY